MAPAARWLLAIATGLAQGMTLPDRGEVARVASGKKKP